MSQCQPCEATTTHNSRSLILPHRFCFAIDSLLAWGTYVPLPRSALFSARPRSTRSGSSPTLQCSRVRNQYVTILRPYLVTPHHIILSSHLISSPSPHSLPSHHYLTTPYPTPPYSISPISPLPCSSRSSRTAQACPRTASASPCAPLLSHLRAASPRPPRRWLPGGASSSRAWQAALKSGKCLRS